MSQKRTQISTTILITLFAALISSGICCTDLEWKCDSGECIAADELCEGTVHCADGSDETAESCIQQTCPSFAFRCAYGACVRGTAECNGQQDCADNSDETSELCQDIDNSIRNSNCLTDQYTCKSGECISQDIVCDGNSDCADQSDETVEICASNYCPPFAFRCGYGACISIDKKCDGTPDCRDGSDEALNLCGTKPPPTPPRKPPGTKTTPSPTTAAPPANIGCPAPNIPNSHLVFEADQTKVIKPGDIVPDGTSINYQCKKGFTREGLQYNLCFNSTWYTTVHVECTKFCPLRNLLGVTYQAKCIRDGTTIPCDDRIKPGTLAKLTCQVKYRKPARNPPDTLVCQEEGQWDYEPFSCEPICGEELTRIQAFVANGEPTNITYVPWHVGIYQRFSGSYRHHCGGTIISAKVVISAAHCFWDNANLQAYDKSYYAVGAGKYLKDFYANEPNAQLRNISELALPQTFNGETENFLGDIAVLVLTNFLKFSPFAAPICVEWLAGAAQSLPSGVFGKTAGWGLDAHGIATDDLQTVDMQSSSFHDCKASVMPTYADKLTNDKFCVLNKFGTTVCQGDSGGGFTVKKSVSGKNVFYLWGVVSGGVPKGARCQEYDFVSYTNIQYYQSLIESRMTTNRPK